MRAVSIDTVTPGATVARTIYGLNGEVLLARGVALNEAYISRLREIGILSLFISDEFIGDIEVDNAITEQTRLGAKQLVGQAMKDIRQGAVLNVKKLNQVVSNIIDEIMNNRNLMVCLADIRAMNDYNFAHAVNVAVLSVVVGVAMGYNRPQLKQLAVGGLFHDIGKSVLDEEILIQSREQEFTDAFRKEYESHAVLGFEILKKVPGISLLSAHTAFQHHEKINGTGYPRGLRGEKINEYARIVAIANTYDHLTTVDSGQPKMFPQQAIEYLILNSGTFFDAEITKVFVKGVAVFPVGTLVKLSTGEKGVVTMVNKQFPTRPQVRIIKDSTNSLVKPPYEINLMEAHAHFLAKVINEEEFYGG